MNLAFLFGAGAHQLGGGGAEGVGDIFVHGKLFEVDGIEEGKHVEGNVERSFGIVHEIADDDVILAEDAIASDEAEDFVSETGHGGEGFDFLIGEAGGLEDGSLDDFATVADESTARVGTAFYRELDALGNSHTRDLLEKSLAATRIRFGVGSGVCERLGVGNGGTA